MRIALCVSGHLRNYQRLKDSYEGFRQFCSSYGQVDVFVATWNRLNSSSSWSGSHGLTLESSVNQEVFLNEISDFYKTNDISIEDDLFFASEYSPLRYNIFTNKKYDWDTRGINSNNVIHSYRMFYLINKANNLKLYKEYLNQHKYDLVIRIRPDMFFYESVYQTYNLKEMAESKKLYAVKHKTDHKINYGYGDRFVLGSSDTMDKFSSIIYNIGGNFGEPEDIMLNIIHKIISFNQISFIESPEGLLNENGGSHNIFFLR